MACPTISSSSKQQRTIWMWKSNADPWENIETEGWKRYEDIENCMIESAFEQKKNQVELDDFWIDLKHQVQINKQDSNKQTPIKRVTNMSDDKYVRERFTNQQSALTAKSFRGNFMATFLANAGLWDVKISDEWVEKAARGIEAEGEKLGRKTQAERIAIELRKVKGKEEKEILGCCVKLYTIESFLYKLINKIMTEAGIEDVFKGNYAFVSQKDESYARTLGPYCCMLFQYLCHEEAPKQKNVTVFRSGNLTEEMIRDYKKNVGLRVLWEGFSSTTKNKEIALFYDGNTLFQIRIPSNPICQCVEISSLSEYPDEEEILLSPGTGIMIEKVEYDSKIKKHVIHLGAEENWNDLLRRANGIDLTSDDK
ncbi:unnamed protein product [Didymodactylos carnosus]|uniref:NAD(P)(+)--arginine ADP-ribosyltransferase n=1 Tax=Didymodactylos carnosus TaxID=1234261 RepID=A0A815UY88_9BILA|nr:unnamed protein product [Didymodactylos carnosus]CAF1526055.1 unnamed protein product [Didymodactylos carnosus]CAF4137143.1 unnamed protein product [Didymodactylos carnosus]CAF4384999.1 unnamed protein product [Didymodactylos carnosus]